MKNKRKKLVVICLCLIMALTPIMFASAKTYTVPSSIGYSITSFLGEIFNGVFKRNVIEYVTIKDTYVSKDKSITVHADDAEVSDVYFFSSLPGSKINTSNSVSTEPGKEYYCVVVLSDGHVSGAKKVTMHSHNYKNQTVLLNATCTQEGQARGTCSCGATKLISIPATGHNFAEYVSNDDATCLTYGSMTATCGVCGYKSTVLDKSNPPLGHSFTNYVFDESTRGTDSMTETAKCDRCSVKNTREYSVPYTYTISTSAIDYYVTDTQTGKTTKKSVFSGTPHVIIDNYTGTDSDVTIPAYIEGYPVVKISSYAFMYDKTIKSVSIPESVIYIGHDAFEGCDALESVTIPNSVRFIDSGAFAYCDSLRSIFVDSNNEYYTSMDGVLCSKDCKMIVSVPANYTKSNSSSPETTFSVPEGVIIIGYDAFGGCENFENISLSDTVQIIENYAFSCCDSITEFNFTDSVTTIGKNVFCSCNKLESVTIPASVTQIGIFQCDSITSINVDENNTVYDSRGNCNAIIETATNTLIIGCNNSTIPDSVVAIADEAFEDTNIENISIPTSVTSIGFRAFFSCYKLIKVEIETGSQLTTIGKEAFCGCHYLENIGMPSSTTKTAHTNAEVRSGVCSNCKYCTKEKVSVYNSDDYKQTIYNCFGTTSSSTCSNARAMTVKVKTFIDGGDDGVVGVHGMCSTVTEMADTGCKHYYYNSDANCYYCNCCEKEVAVTYYYCGGHCQGHDAVNIYKLPDSITTIGERAFESCYYLKFINIPTGMTELNNSVFEGCSSLTEIVIPDNITSIGNTVFEACRHLADITLSDSVTYIGWGAFDDTAFMDDESNWTDGALYLNNCLIRIKPTFTSYDVIPGTKLIAGGAFVYDSSYENHEALTSVTIPDSVKTIGAAAFVETDITSIEIPEGVTTIGTSAFSECKMLKTVSLPSTLTTEDNDVTEYYIHAFEDCDNLTDVYYHGTSEDLVFRLMFDGCNTKNVTFHFSAVIDITVIKDGAEVGTVKVIANDGDTITYSDIKNAVAAKGYDTTYNDCYGLDLPVTVVGGSTYNVTMEILE